MWKRESWIQKKHKKKESKVKHIISECMPFLLPSFFFSKTYKDTMSIGKGWSLTYTTTDQNPQNISKNHYPHIQKKKTWTEREKKICLTSSLGRLNVSLLNVWNLILSFFFQILSSPLFYFIWPAPFSTYSS